MIDLTRSQKGYTLHLDDETARTLCHLLTQARPRGVASHDGLTVRIEGGSAEPRPSHHPIDDTTAVTK